MTTDEMKRLQARNRLLEHVLKSANAECKRRGDALLKLTNETKKEDE